MPEEKGEEGNNSLKIPGKREKRGGGTRSSMYCLLIRLFPFAETQIQEIGRYFLYTLNIFGHTLMDAFVSA